MIVLLPIKTISEIQQTHFAWASELCGITNKRTSRPYAHKEDATICEMYESHTVREMAAALGGGRTENSVRNRCWLLRLCSKANPITKAEVEIIRAAYASAGIDPVCLYSLSKQLGRTRAVISRLAQTLGLSNSRRRKRAGGPTDRRKFKGDSEALRHHQSSERKKWMAEHEHPKGMLEKKHTKESLEAVSRSVKARWNDPKSSFHTPEIREKRAKNMHKNIQLGKIGFRGQSAYSRCSGGKRSDLGDTYYRSSWEANYARYLNFLIKHKSIAKWLYEPKTFNFDGIKRGTMSYTPDFQVFLLNGSYEWHEVKGWMNAESKTRLSRMAKHFPTEKVIVIGEEWFRSATKKGLPAMIPNWEVKKKVKKE